MTAEGQIPIAGQEAPAEHVATSGGEGSSDRPLDDPRAIQILSAEHWSLLATRSMSWNESFSRTGLFLSVLSASVVALGLVGGATGFGGEFPVFALSLLPVTLFVGIATFVRLDEVNLEDAIWVAAMNRIRHAYLEVRPGLEPYFTSGWTDDEYGIAQTFAMTQEPTAANTLVHQFVTTPGMVAVIDGALAAAISGIGLAAVSGPAGPGMLATIPLGLIVGVATTTILMWTSVRRGRRVMRGWVPRFPKAGPPGRIPMMGYWGEGSGAHGGKDGGGQPRP